MLRLWLPLPYIDLLPLPLVEAGATFRPLRCSWSPSMVTVLSVLSGSTLPKTTHCVLVGEACSHSECRRVPSKLTAQIYARV